MLETPIYLDASGLLDLAGANVQAPIAKHDCT